MYKTFIENISFFIKKTIKNTWKTIKFIVLNVIPRLAFVAFVVVPFLNKRLPQYLACWIWIPSFFIFVGTEIYKWKKSRGKEPSVEIADVLSRGFALEVISIFGSVFVLNYFDTHYDWKWALLVNLGVMGTFALCNMFKWAEISQHKQDQFKTKTLQYILYLWLLLAFFACVVSGLTHTQFIFGVPALLILLYSVSSEFLSQKFQHKWMLVHDFACSIALSAYLIYAIPNDSLQNIILVLVSSIYGGFIALVGVAWTIKDGKRQELESRRLEKMPYLQANFDDWMTSKKGEELSCQMYLSITRSQNERCANFGKSLEITNIGLGMATDLRCEWIVEGLTNAHNFPVSILKCNDTCKFNIMGFAQSSDENAYFPEGAMVFVFKDLLGNQYNQELKIHFEVYKNRIVITSSEMVAPKYINE